MNCRPFQVTLAMLVVLTLLVTACAPTATPSPTPSGGGTGRIAFTSNRDGNGEIYVMNADGSGQTRLTNNPAEDMCPAWQP